MITTKSFLNNILEFVKKVVIVTIIILILAGLFWWFLGPHTNERWEKILFYGGGLVIIIGLFIRFGSKEGTYSTMYHYARIGGSTSPGDRVEQARKDLVSSYSDFLVLFTAGLIAIGLSFLVNKYM